MRNPYFFIMLKTKCNKYKTHALFLIVISASNTYLYSVILTLVFLGQLDNNLISLYHTSSTVSKFTFIPTLANSVTRYRKTCGTQICSMALRFWQCLQMFWWQNLVPRLLKSSSACRTVNGGSMVWHSVQINVWNSNRNIQMKKYNFD